VTLTEYVALRKAELDQFLVYNAEKRAQHGDAWMPEDMPEEELFEQELAWLDMKRQN
jgi:hypothetical protein